MSQGRERTKKKVERLVREVEVTRWDKDINER